MPSKKPEPTKFKAGDWVTYPLYPEPGVARVIEVRGPLGVAGEQIYRLRVVQDWGEVQEFEQRESVLQPTDPPARQPQPAPPDSWLR